MSNGESATYRQLRFGGYHTKPSIKFRVRVRIRVRVRVSVRVRVRVTVRTILLSVDPGIELVMTVFVTSRRYRQTNSAQALKRDYRIFN